MLVLAHIESTTFSLSPQHSLGDENESAYRENCGPLKARQQRLYAFTRVMKNAKNIDHGLRHFLNKTIKRVSCVEVQKVHIKNINVSILRYYFVMPGKPLLVGERG